MYLINTKSHRSFEWRILEKDRVNRRKGLSGPSAPHRLKDLLELHSPMFGEKLPLCSYSRNECAGQNKPSLEKNQQNKKLAFLNQVMQEPIKEKIFS